MRRHGLQCSKYHYLQQSYIENNSVSTHSRQGKLYIFVEANLFARKETYYSDIHHKQTSKHDIK